ncbi:uncharacterized protein Z519_12118 [Cladophialophora bantiana CBS 173.52]|uniref:Uncharacterized protein n=1 Tax=Cladophialophora bantiana (strain ATCC 10958 / CBS 173.52 / CDC B-1940 / NIH 8579) TaxID=1442370 RepID=A0A0D2H8I8_CLAB1|nr:uncharacterized protein Z519_12118 [Cladophialophora bantiana CBS 173.52]KIW87215.1 hypothetical protein Z519_12118 [Cladophialophora bantiana CBS 173.52]
MDSSTDGTANRKTRATTEMSVDKDADAALGMSMGKHADRTRGKINDNLTELAVLALQSLNDASSSNTDAVQMRSVETASNEITSQPIIVPSDREEDHGANRHDNCNENKDPNSHHEANDQTANKRNGQCYTIITEGGQERLIIVLSDSEEGDGENRNDNGNENDNPDNGDEAARDTPREPAAMSDGRQSVAVIEGCGRVRPERAGRAAREQAPMTARQRIRGFKTLEDKSGIDIITRRRERERQEDAIDDEQERRTRSEEQTSLYRYFQRNRRPLEEQLVELKEFLAHRCNPAVTNRRINSPSALPGNPTFAQLLIYWDFSGGRPSLEGATRLEGEGEWEWQRRPALDYIYRMGGELASLFVCGFHLLDAFRRTTEQKTTAGGWHGSQTYNILRCHQRVLLAAVCNYRPMQTAGFV